ncbi:MAG: hypothetical protein UY76_C0040G0003 [Candidatus Uhrbacteria bacterium GW2011_GWA2_52_8d]|uniref:Uncharacterized protein n=1 Tax=Candidatus Uhrbacteria bacterium GW2011_GWA2_52_8d TaxID=1618979 RepID=A0A0G1XLI5_9BACT|nr:MAG: hypothetical protein UY76_C0040G0003 [Candidatus Uhrbacteria bacterium GW2011_GWA2_52_8d]
MGQNPITGTKSTDLNSRVITCQPIRLEFFEPNLQRAMNLLVMVEVPGVLCTSLEEEHGVALGAAIVIAQDEFMQMQGLPVARVYKDLLNASRAMEHAQDYYQGEIPMLVMLLPDAQWALLTLHDSEDLSNPALALKRRQKLEEIIKLLGGGTGQSKRRAVVDAKRALVRTDKEGRANASYFHLN